jgi:molybdopterin-guanine dinucleotide biosynthesis protein A
MIPLSDITAIILAGGRGSRMGGVDKGLQSFNGTPLALHTLLRLQMQSGGQNGGALGQVMVNANRNLSVYESFGSPVWPDVIDGYAGPLAGFLTGLERCETPYLVTLPCDTPLFPLDLVARLAQAMSEQDAQIAMAVAPETDEQGHTSLRPQPVFCLMAVDLLESLVAFTQAGGRKIDAWTAGHKLARVAFDLPGDDARAFFNANTLAELQSLNENL